MTLDTDLKLKIKKIIFFTGDTICLYFALFLALLIRYNFNISDNLFFKHIPYFTTLYIMWLVILYALRLYETNKIIKNKYEIIVSIINFSIMNFFLSVLYFYITPQNIITPKTILVLNILIFGILFYIWRFFANKALYRYKIQQNSLVITNNPDLLKSINQKPELELNIKTYINPLNNINLDLIEKTSIENLEDYLENNKIQSIVIDDDLLFDNNISGKLLKCINLKIEVIKTTEFYEKYLGKVVLKNINQMWLISNLNENKKFIFDFGKNIFEKIFTFILLILSLIIVPFIIIGIKVGSRGPIFFKQYRTGKNGENFLAMKFRTMIDNAEKNGAQWASKNDSRITKFGKFLRKTRLDEIPQFINILKGDMSLIGPRPERPEFIESLEKEIPFYSHRLLVKPGLSGWAQINYPYGNTIDDAIEKLEYDLYYIKNRNLALDISIILKTIDAVVKGGGM